VPAGGKSCSAFLLEKAAKNTKPTTLIKSKNKIHKTNMGTSTWMMTFEETRLKKEMR
jgi:hypothetical protein